MEPDSETQENVILLCINSLSTDLKPEQFKNETYCREFLSLLNEKEHLPHLPDFYINNLDYFYKSLIAAAKSEIQVTELVRKAREYLNLYKQNYQTKKMLYPFYYLKKYDVFQLLCIHASFLSSEATEIKTLRKEWAKELLQKLGNIMKVSGQTGNIAFTFLSNFTS